MKIKSLFLCGLLLFSHNSRLLSGEILASLFGLCIAAKALLEILTDPTARFYAAAISGSIAALIGALAICDRAPSLNDLLLKACEAENRNRIKLLQRLGADINEGYYDPPTHFVLDVVLKKDKKFLDFLVQQGLQVPPGYLHRATQANDIELVKKYLQCGVDATKARYTKTYNLQYDYSEADCMHHACYYGNKDMIELLLKAGLDINDKSAIQTTTPITYAYGSLEGLRILDYLIDKGSLQVFNPWAYCISDFLAILKTLHVVSDAEKIIDNIMYAKSFSYDGELGERFWKSQFIECLYQFITALCLCIKDEEKKYNLLTKLCTHRAIQYAYLNYGYHVQDGTENATLIQFLLQRNKEFFDLELMEEYVVKSCEDGKISYVTCLLQDDRIDAKTKAIGLQNACIAQNKKIVQLLLDQGVDLDFIDDCSGDSLLHTAAASSIDMVNMILPYYDDLQKVLSKVNNQNKTAFYVGCESGIYNNINEYFFQQFLDSYARNQFLHDELCCAAKVLESSRLNHIFTFCLRQDVDFNRRNREEKRPVDIALSLYENVAMEPCWNSEYFINKEKIMHAFMDKTEYIKDKKVVRIFLSHFPKDIIGRVLHYYHAVNVDYWVAKKVIAQNNNQYYKKTKQQKEQYKTEVIMQANAVMNALLCKPKEIQ